MEGLGQVVAAAAETVVDHVGLVLRVKGVDAGAHAAHPLGIPGAEYLHRLPAHAVDVQVAAHANDLARCLSGELFLADGAGALGACLDKSGLESWTASGRMENIPVCGSAVDPCP